jgi:hypothetical protein
MMTPMSRKDSARGSIFGKNIFVWRIIKNSAVFCQFWLHCGRVAALPVFSQSGVFTPVSFSLINDQADKLPAMN